ncbi:MAG: hypothetical protein WCC58_06180 [Burkholderiales bacterium]
MADREIITIDAAPSDGLVKLTHIIYGLHAFSIITGLIGAATIVGMFLTGWPSIIAVIINYVKRGDVKGTYLESHFRWQIRTFWYALLWCVVAGLAFVTLIGIPIFFVIVFALSIWLIYRIVLGWINLNAGKPMYS